MSIMLEVQASQINHMEYVVSSLFNLYIEPGDNCLLLNMMHSIELSEHIHPSLFYKWMDEDLIDFIANESPCSILLMEGNEGVEFNYLESKSSSSFIKDYESNNIFRCGCIARAQKFI